MFNASIIAPYPAPSSCVPTIGAGESFGFGRRLPSMSGGSRPSPTTSSGTTFGTSRKNCTARAFGSPFTILFFSSA